MTATGGPRMLAPYMHWAKTHSRAAHDLTGSNLLAVELDELPGAAEALRLSGPNDEGYGPLLEAIAERYGVAPERVCTAPGTSGANFLAMAAVLRPGDEVVIEHPTYDPLLGIAELLGARVRRFERRFEDGYLPDADAIEEQIGPDTRLVVITNLHNPSGALIPASALREIGKRAAGAGVRVLVDEVYRETAFERPGPPIARDCETFISTNSLTKAWGLSGLRSGWVIASPELAEAMHRVRDVVDAVGSFPSDVIARVAFDEMERLRERARAILVENSRRLATVLDAASDAGTVEWVRPPVGASISFPRLTGTEDAGPFVERVLERQGVGVVPGRFFGAPEHFRVAIGGDPERVGPALDALADGLREWAGGRGSAT